MTYNSIAGVLALSGLFGHLYTNSAYKHLHGHVHIHTKIQTQKYTNRDTHIDTHTYTTEKIKDNIM